jgi:hypothetical protein
MPTARSPRASAGSTSRSSREVAAIAALPLYFLTSGGVRVPWAKVHSIGSTIALSATAAELGLGAAERKAERLIPKGGAL